MEKKQKLETDRFILRPFTLDDAEAMFSNWASDPEVTKFLTFTPHENIGVTKNILSKWVDEYQDPQTIRYGITIKETGELVGGIDVVNFIDGVPEIGYCLAKKCWGKGYMTEACKTVVKYIFMLGFKKIFIRANADNIGSNRVIQKCGFKFVKCEYIEKHHGNINFYELEYDPKILETDRLILREMNDDDFKSLQKVISDPVNMKYYAEPYDEKGVQRWIDWCKGSYIRRGFGLWAVVLKETGEMIGDCGISMQMIDDELKPEVGYHLRLDYHQQGIGKEMTQAVRDYFFIHFNYDEVYSYMDKDNLPSYKTAEANGMTYLHLYTTKDGEVCRVYRITRSEWEEIKK